MKLNTCSSWQLPGNTYIYDKVWIKIINYVKNIIAKVLSNFSWAMKGFDELLATSFQLTTHEGRMKAD